MALGRGGPTEKETFCRAPRGVQGPLNFSIDRILAPDFGLQSCRTGLELPVDGVLACFADNAGLYRRRSVDYDEVYRSNLSGEKPGFDCPIRRANSTPNGLARRRLDFWSPRKLLALDEDGERFPRNDLSSWYNTSPFGKLDLIENFKHNTWPSRQSDTQAPISNNLSSPVRTDLNLDVLFKLHLSKKTQEDGLLKEDRLSNKEDKTEDEEEDIYEEDKSRYRDRTKAAHIKRQKHEMSDISKKRRLSAKVNQLGVDSEYTDGKQTDSEAVDEPDKGSDLQDKISSEDNDNNSEPSPDDKQFRWPIWVYVTRYSARPSSGPRSRRQKRPCNTPNDEKRARTAFTSAQLARLRQEFQANRYLTEQSRITLAAELKLSEAQVKIWFQNRRAKVKRTDRKNPLALQLMAEGLYNHREHK